MTPRPHLRAKLTFLSTVEGGWTQWPKLSGIRPLLKVKQEYTSCAVWATSGGDSFEAGLEYLVELQLLSWELYRTDIGAGMAIELFAGSKRVGRGTVLEILSR